MTKCCPSPDELEVQRDFANRKVKGSFVSPRPGHRTAMQIPPPPEATPQSRPKLYTPQQMAQMLNPDKPGFGVWGML
jgi:hypothetical protein